MSIRHNADNIGITLYIMHKNQRKKTSETRDAIPLYNSSVRICGTLTMRAAFFIYKAARPPYAPETRRKA